MLYMFVGLAIICDDYFTESLDKISEALGLSEDVAGATFMAAGSSAPELFTAIISVLITGEERLSNKPNILSNLETFITKRLSDMLGGSEGLGTIVGSAVFNIMVIVGATAYAACEGGKVLRLAWYPLARDSFIYFISIITMLIVMNDFKVNF